MKNLNKVLALVIVLAMAFSTVAFASFSDVTEDASYAEAVEVMSALGLLAGYEDGSFGPDKTITRAEFSAVIVRALGMEESAKGVYGATNFSDVAADAWYAGYVMIASQQGIVNGYPNGTFKPEAPVKFEEAVKMIMCTLNYQKKFEKVENPYPTAYIAEAHTTGITLGANLAIGQEASRAIVARLVYNALTVGKMRQIAFGTEDQWAVPENAYTLLSENLAVARIEGSISAVKFDGSQKLIYTVTDVAPQFDSAVNRAYYYYPNTPIGKAGDQLTMKYADGVNLIKHYATIAYVDVTDSANPVVLAVVEKPGANETLTITATQAKDGVYTAATASATGSLTYFKTSSEVDSQATTAKLAKGAVAYTNLNTATANNTAFASNYNTGLYPVITLIDNNANEPGYEVIYADEYYAGIVEEINDRSFRITLNAAQGIGAKAAITLNPANEDYTFAIFDEEGAEIAFEDIKKDDVLNIFTSKDDTTTNYEIYVTSTKVEGTVSEQVDANHFVVDGEEYFSYVSTLLSGDSGIFYVDMFNKILKFELSEDSNRNFAVLYALYNDTSNPLENEPKAVLYTANGEFVEYGFAKNINVNNTAAADNNTKYDQLSLDALKADVAGGSFALLDDAQRVVMYTVNGAGDISEIYSGAGITARDDRYLTDAFAATDSDNDGVEDVADSGDSYKENAARLGSAVIPEDFTFAAVATDVYQDTTIAGIKKSEWSSISASVLNEDDKYYYDLVYNKETKNAAFGVLFGVKAKVAGSDPVMLVTNVGTGTDADGISVVKLTGYVDGLRTAITIADDALWYDVANSAIAKQTLAKGALIQYNGVEEADAIRVLVTDAQMLATAKGTSGALTLGEIYATADKENDDKNGYLVADTMAEYASGAADLNNVGSFLTVAGSTPTTLIRFTTTAIGNIYGGDIMAFGVAERDDYIYGESPDTNGDIVIVYCFDGDAQAAVILDTDNDDIWN